MKLNYKLHLLALLFLFANNLYGQVVQWQTLFGGSLPDRGWSINETLDGETIIAGQTLSTNGDITRNAGSADAFVAKVRPDGKLRWFKTYGGTSVDYTGKVIPTPDGGFILCGFTQSTNGAFASNHGMTDAYALKIDKDGEMEWQKLFGGSQNDEFESVLVAPDGGFIFIGWTQSTDGDLTPDSLRLRSNGWIVKTDSDGEVEWQRLYGGEENDFLGKSELTPDGGFVVFGNTASTAVDVTDPKGKNDTWIVKFDINGTIEWQKTLGGSEDDGLGEILPIEDGYMVIAGSRSSDQDLSSNRGDTDSALYYLDLNGNLKSAKSFGGSRNDFLDLIVPYGNGTFLLAGNTLSPIYPTLPRFSGSSWLMVVDKFGNIISESLTDKDKTGNYFDLHRNRDGSFTFLGTTDATINNMALGGLDIWMGRLLSKFNLIDGTAYVDLNENGMQDSTDALVNNVAAFTQRDSFSLTTHVNQGNFDFYLQNGDYTTKLESVSPYFEVEPDSAVSNFSAVNALDEVTFRLSPIGNQPEISTFLIPLSIARPGRRARYRLFINNYGNTQLDGNANVTFKTDKLRFAEATANNLSTIDSVLTFRFDDLNPFEERSIDISFIVALPPIANFADVLFFESSVPQFPGETDLDNNIDTLFQTIRGAYDPNDKTILSANTIRPEALEEEHIVKYLIRFQNTGNDTAFNIFITDTLSGNHLPETLQPLASSHNYRTELSKSGNLTIYFDDILLVDSFANEPKSHGFFSYQVQLKNLVPADSVVRNTAHIYFDFNPPIKTNTTLLKIESPPVVSNSSKLNSFKKLSVFPNPTSNVLDIEFEAQETAELNLILLDLSGTTISRKREKIKFGKNKFRVDCADLPNGIYFLKLVGSNEKQSIKITKVD